MLSGYLSCPFDLLNVSDLDLIAQAGARCDRLVVGVFSDEYVARINGRPPVVPLEERTALLRHMRGVDEVVVHDDTDFDERQRSGVVFGVVDVIYEQLSCESGAIIWLEPARESISAVLRDALRPQSQSAVA